MLNQKLYIQDLRKALREVLNCQCSGMPDRACSHQVVHISYSLLKMLTLQITSIMTTVKIHCS